MALFHGRVSALGCAGGAIGASKTPPQPAVAPQRSRHMYEKVVAEPRLTAYWHASGGVPLAPPVLESMRESLSQRYGTEFDSAGLNLYRDGRDSVAWHRDRIAREIADPIVALVSLGHPRRF